MNEQVMISRELLADLIGNEHDKRIMAERHLLAMLANAPAQPVSAQPAGEVVAVVAAAKALCKHHADICGVNSDDQWNVYSDEFIIDAKIVLEAIKRARIIAAPQGRAVVMPERKHYHDYLNLYDKGEAIGHNNALNEVARLNGKGGV